MGKRSHGGQKKQYKASFKYFNIPTEPCEQNAQDRAKWRGLIRRFTSEFEAKRINDRVFQQSFLPRTSHVLSATGSLELRLVSSAILEHTNSNTSRI